jgi:isopenicillin N synthase-like dioxygenase
VQVPLIDCNPRLQDEQALAVAMDHALRDSGFMALGNIGFEPALVADTFAAARRFFASSDALKQRCAYRSAAENFGYQGIGIEKLDPNRPGDLKETFTMRNVLKAPLAAERWPDAAFQAQMDAFYRRAMQAAARLQRLLALALGQPREFFVACHGGENVTLRLLHYPPIEAAQAQQMGAGAHTDYGMLTLLLQDDVGGLQVQDRAGNWHEVPPRPGAVVINCGDLLERWSNGRYRSTTHRVLPRLQGRDRYSIAMFVDPDSATQVEVLPSCVSDGIPARFPPTTAGEHLQAKIEATHGS